MASKRKQDQTEQLRRRIVAFHRVKGRDLRAHPANARRHPAVQREAFAAMMARIGQAGVLMAYRDPEAPDKLTLYDGHLRSEDFAEAVWDVAETDLTPDEAAEMLLSFDLVGAMAEYHAGALASLRDRAGDVHEALRERVEDLIGHVESSEQNVGFDTAGESRGNLADRFLVAPFSVLDARQGWWQDRKRAWLALGIRSELGRGGVSQASTPPHGPSVTQNADGTLNYKPPRGRRPNAIPGGAAMPRDRGWHG